MSNQVRVSSIDALETFRAELIQYLTKARAALEDVTGDVRRTRDWLDRDRYIHWSTEIKKRTKLLRQAEQELYSANLTRPLESNAMQKMAVHRAKRFLDEAEERMRVLSKWRQRFDRMANPHVRELDPLFSILSQNLPRAVASLGESIKALQSYAEKFPTTPAPPSPPPEISP